MTTVCNICEWLQDLTDPKVQKRKLIPYTRLLIWCLAGPLSPDIGNLHLISLSFLSLPTSLSLPPPSFPSSVLLSMLLSTLYEASIVVYLHTTFQRLSVLVIPPWISSSAQPAFSSQAPVNPWSIILLSYFIPLLFYFSVLEIHYPNMATC